jgi:beta-fructofuranosidase
MALRLPDRWIWDFWLAQDGPDHHLFFLQAPKHLEDPDLRHRHATVGHAVSHDLRSWEILPDALGPGPAGSFDDGAIWTGSVIRAGGRWCMLYTGVRAGGGLEQRIGLATSDDLVTWERWAVPVLEPEPRWYEPADHARWPNHAWRDPWVFEEPGTGAFVALITARTRRGPVDGRGVIAAARSEDLVSWEVLPPVTEPGDFHQLEVPQLVRIDGSYHLLFTATAADHSSSRRRRSGAVTGTYYMVAEHHLGPFRPGTEVLLAGDATGSTYAGKLMQDPALGLVFLAWKMHDQRGRFVGEIEDPLPVRRDPHGRLVVVGRAG